VGENAFTSKGGIAGAMILLHHTTNNGPQLAVKTDGGVFDAGGTTLEDVFAGTTPTPGDQLDEASLTLAPSVPHPGKLICIGLNYRKHAEETKSAIPSAPIVFAKFHNALAASGEEVAIPAATEQADYEAELVIVIGRRARNVPESRALDHVWGYTNGNDLSARDLQNQSSQWVLGKTPDKFGPIGPWLVSRDEAGELGPQPIRCLVNGQVRQESTLGDMIFGVPELVAFLSKHFTLDPGDVIYTGTPSGVALGQPHPKPWLRPGDEVVVEIGNLGRLVNRMTEGS
jgi:2-keto-4-pentenoate hydratase/2-oxohepta-3-ene-1,7-dioic acid hydratase in catechol pathway